MLSFYGHYKYLNSFSAWTDLYVRICSTSFARVIVTSILAIRMTKITVWYVNMWAKVVTHVHGHPQANSSNCSPANTGHWPNVVSMLGQRHRRWVNIKTTSGQCLVFAGLGLLPSYCCLFITVQTQTVVTYLFPSEELLVFTLARQLSGISYNSVISICRLRTQWPVCKQNASLT